MEILRKNQKEKPEIMNIDIEMKNAFMKPPATHKKRQKDWKETNKTVSIQREHGYVKTLKNKNQKKTIRTTKQI